MMALLRLARTMTRRRRKYYLPETDPTVFPPDLGNTLDISDSSDIGTLSPGDFSLEIFANNVVIIQSHTQGLTFIQLNIAIYCEDLKYDYKYYGKSNVISEYSTYFPGFTYKG